MSTSTSTTTHRILIATDFSEASFNAVRFAMDTFGTNDAEFILFHAVYLAPRDPMLLGLEEKRMEKQAARKKLAAFKLKCQGLRIAGRTNFVSIIGDGNLTDAVNAVCRRRTVHAVVLGTRGAGDAIYWGDNATQVVKHCVRPVIAVPPAWEPGPIQNILFADDRSEVPKRKPMALLLQLARQHKAEVTLAYVREGSMTPLEVSPLAMDAVLFKGVKRTPVSLSGDDVAKTLCKLTDGGKYAMLGVLHRDLGWLDRIFNRSVAKKLTLCTKVPLLVLHM